MFSILSSCFQVGLGIFILYRWSKIPKQGELLYQNKQTNQPRRNAQIKQTKEQTNTSKLAFLKVITSQLQSKGLYLCSSVHLR